MQISRKNRVILGAVISLLIIAAASSLGSTSIRLSDTILIIMHHLFGFSLAEISPVNVSIVWLLRLPRVLLAFFAGGALAMSGAVCQSILRNPLASPYILGVSSGASLGAGLIIISGFSLLGAFTLPLAGFIFGLATVLFVSAF
jgi:iron complex transport system permease protein